MPRTLILILITHPHCSHTLILLKHSQNKQTPIIRTTYNTYTFTLLPHLLITHSQYLHTHVYSQIHITYIHIHSQITHSYNYRAQTLLTQLQNWHSDTNHIHNTYTLTLITHLQYSHTKKIGHTLALLTVTFLPYSHSSHNYVNQSHLILPRQPEHVFICTSIFITSSTWHFLDFFLVSETPLHFSLCRIVVVAKLKYCHVPSSTLSLSL